MNNPSENVIFIMQKLAKRGQTLAFAESCTGGGLSALFVAEAGASQFFKGSVVSYAREVKANILDVPLSMMQCLGEVSVPVALEMARGVRKKLKADWGLSITGIAGPSGGTREKPVGTVCFGLIGPAYEFSQTQIFNSKVRTEIQKMSVHHAVEMLRSAF